MKLSVIIPTRNRSELLGKALESLTAQTLSQEHFEVIVVDNGSTDNTFEVVNSFKTRLKNIRYFLEHQPGLHVGRHKGFLEAKSDLLVYADDDIEALPTWLQAIENSFGDEEVFMVGGKCLPRFEGEPPAWLNAMWSPNAAGERILGCLSVIDLGSKIRFVDPYHIYGCNFTIRRSVLFEAGGFHPDGMPQELIRFRGDGESHVSQYVQSKGYKALYNPMASIYHWVPKSRMTIDYFCRRSYNQGVSNSYTAIRQAHGIDSAPIPAKTNSILDFYQRLRSKSLFEIFVAVLQIIKRMARQLNGFVQKETTFQQNLSAARQAGYAYHQKQVKESPELLAWVLRPNYWNFRPPSLSRERKPENDRSHLPIARELR